jgi:hypothetical protein
VSVPAGARAGQLVPCPRCGERFPYHGPAPDGNGTAPAAAPLPDALEPSGTAAAVHQPLVDRVGERLRRWPKQNVAWFVIAVMVLMAAAGLTLALLTQAYRRGNDLRTPPEESAARVRVTAPADLAALGYLPPDTDVIVGVHVAEARQAPAGQEFLKRFQPAGALPGQPEQGPGLPGTLEQWTGLSLDEIDHAVLGLDVANQAIPHLVLVVQTRHRYDPEKVQRALRATRSPEAGKNLFRFHVERPPVNPVLRFAAERTLIVTLFPEDMERVPATPEPGIAHLELPLQEVLKTRLAPGDQVWAVGHAADWEKTTAKLLLAAMRKEDRQVLEKVPTFAAWLQFSEDLRLNGAFHCTDDAAAQALAKYLAGPEGGERKPLRLPGVAAESEAVARELARTLKVVREGADWVLLQAKAGPEAVRQGRDADTRPARPEP